MTDNNYAEKRRDPRYLVQEVTAFHNSSNDIFGEVINLSLSGMLVAHRTMMAVDSVYEILIPLDHAPNELADFTAKVQVKWFRQNDISGLYGSGLEFLDNDEEQRDQVYKILKAFSVLGVI